MREFDAMTADRRRLIAYYGENRVLSVLNSCEPGDVPRKLGDVSGFRAWCARLDAELPQPKPEQRPDADAAWSDFTRRRTTC